MNASIALLIISFLLCSNAILLGSWLLVRKQMMMGDTLAHAVLPGIVLSFIITKNIHYGSVLAGALFSSCLAVGSIVFLEQKLKRAPSEAISFTFLSFFSLGLLLISIYGKKVDLDVECVLSRSLLIRSIERFSSPWWSTIGPPALYELFFLWIMNIGGMIFYYHHLLVSSFDRDYAVAVGAAPHHVNYLFLMAVATNITFFFRIAGMNLPLVFLALPVATAFLTANDFTSLIGIAHVVGINMIGIGYFLSLSSYGSPQGCMVCVGIIHFILIWLLSANKK